jgi:hypothetical protein
MWIADFMFQRVKGKKKTRFVEIGQKESGTLDEDLKID